MIIRSSFGLPYECLGSPSDYRLADGFFACQVFVAYRDGSWWVLTDRETDRPRPFMSFASATKALARSILKDYPNEIA